MSWDNYDQERFLIQEIQEQSSMTKPKAKVRVKLDTSEFKLLVNLKFVPYDIQSDAINLLQETKYRNRLIQSPTGSGKTVSGIAGILLRAVTEETRVEYYFNTHDQAAEVLGSIESINDLNPENKPLKVVHVAGRSRLCNFSDVRAQLNEQKRLEMCKKYKKDGTCSFAKGPIITFVEETNIMSIPTILEFSKKRKICPRATLTLAIEQSDLIALPTIYLFIPGLPGLHEKSPHVIIDEAHAFDSHAVEFNSSSISSNMIKSLESEMYDVEDIVDEYGILSVKKMALDLKEKLKLFISHLKLLSIGPNRVTDIEIDNSEISLLAIEIEEFGKQFYIESQSGIEEIPEHITKFKEFCVKLLEARQSPNDFSFQVEIDKRSKRKDGLNYKVRCLNPAYAYERNISFARSVTLMSGTLNPGFMKKILGITDVVIRNYKSPHKNFLAIHISEFMGNSLTTSYKERTIEMLNNYASAVLNIIKNTPDGGTLVFAPSYKMAKRLFDLYDFKVAKFYGGIKGHMEQYKQFINEGFRAVFISALRGSGAEGVNFPDREARSICILGVPFINPNDNLVAAQKTFYENTYGKEFARKWILREAAISAGQAAGRGNRHEYDYCVVYFIDKRFRAIAKFLPRWISEETDWSKEAFIDKMKKGKNFLLKMEEKNKESE